MDVQPVGHAVSSTTAHLHRLLVQLEPSGHAESQLPQCSSLVRTSTHASTDAQYWS
jgi:hypothetical protein